MAVATGTAIAVAAGSGALGKFLGGLSGRNAQKNAMAKQAEAGYDASKMVWDKTNEVNSAIAEQARNGGLQVMETSNNAADSVEQASVDAADSVHNASVEANAGVDKALEGVNENLNPYIDAGKTATGTLGDLLSPDGRYTKMMDEKFNFDPNNDPSYQFVLQQATKAANKSAAARGGMMGGGAMQAMGKLAAGHASKEYAAQFDRFQTDRNNRGTLLNNMTTQLQSVAGRGLDASKASGTFQLDGAKYKGNNTMDSAVYGGNVRMQGKQYAGNTRINGVRYNSDINYNGVQQTSQNSINASMYQGNNRIGVGNAQAAGTIGSNRTFWNGVNGAVNDVGDGLVMGSNLRPRPAGSTGVFNPTVQYPNDWANNNIGVDGKPLG